MFERITFSLFAATDRALKTTLDESEILQRQQTTNAILDRVE